MRRVLSVAGVLLSVFLGSCGSTLPVMRLSYASDNDFRNFVKGIAEHVRCELYNAVAREYGPNDPKRAMLYSWAAKIALTIRALDKSTISPGLTADAPPTVFTIAAGASGSTAGTREMTMTYFLPFKELLDGKKISFRERPPQYCDVITNETGVREPIAGNLGIHQTLKAALETWDSSRTLSERIKNGPFETITHHVTFEVVAGGDITPTWHFVNVIANPNAPFLSGSRTTTDELLITIGPDALGDHKELDRSFEIERLRSAVRRP
ncbi:hypothetical protein GA0061099_1001233 [Bradyrhizobium yuanmingense]|uniref:Lipoprotein n=1 Tax=Bradyrhizobium yuanmingense TaxID=108015 RepID=A0A1C3TYV6_9BRAD|nr:hypothetical protein IQ15_01527 [Bradyrhizobium yuanmingense]SCB08328.1 hypothetical protein GA0061099_1001233 [Bradyrhizobium yuanmingense]